MKIFRLMIYFTTPFTYRYNAGQGTLEYRPDKSMKLINEVSDLDLLAAESEKLLTTNYTGESLEALYNYGGSPGRLVPKYLYG